MIDFFFIISQIKMSVETEKTTRTDYIIEMTLKIKEENPNQPNHVIKKLVNEKLTERSKIIRMKNEQQPLSLTLPTSYSNSTILNLTPSNPITLPKSNSPKLNLTVPSSNTPILTIPTSSSSNTPISNLTTINPSTQTSNSVTETTHFVLSVPVLGSPVLSTSENLVVKKKRTLTPYNNFMSTEIEKIKAGNPNIAHRDAFKMATSNWSSSPLNKKNK